MSDTRPGTDFVLDHIPGLPFSPFPPNRLSKIQVVSTQVYGVAAVHSGYDQHGQWTWLYVAWDVPKRHMVSAETHDRRVIERWIAEL